MHCIRPIKVSQTFDGTLAYKSKSAIPGLIGWALPCRKCLPCRLNLAREKAIRAYHESKMHPNNIFLTMTYDDEHLESPRLIYEHWQTFIKDLRDRVGYVPEDRISTMVTGEYGEKNKRPHWHALLFNYAPTDPKYKYTSDSGFKVFTSEILSSIWERGAVEYGDVTMDSASYVCRYAAKKLVHGPDQDHDYHPIHKTSSKNAIGKRWIEKNWKFTFDNGFVVLPNGSLASIPRYYTDWLKKTHPDAYVHYVTQKLPKIITDAEAKARKEEIEYLSTCLSRSYRDGRYPLTRPQVKERVLQSKFKQLQGYLKL